METEAGRRPRVQDWWRWTVLVSPPGALPLFVMAWRRGRRLWAGAIGLATLGEAVSLGLAIHRAGHVAAGHNSAEGFVGILWILLTVAAWVLPTTDASQDRARRAWPEVTVRARALNARYGLIAYVVSVGGLVVLGLLLRAVGVHLGVGVGVIIVDALLLGSLVPLVLRGQLGRRDLGLRRTQLGAGTGLAIAALIVYLGLAVAWTLAVIHPANSSQTLSKQLGISHHSGAGTVALDVFALAVCAPVCEEIFFRGLLFRSLRNRLSLWPATLIAGSLFGLAHITGYPLNTIPVKMLFGVLMCLLYERTGSLLPCIAVHSFVDGSSADALFAGNIAIALGLSGVALIGVGMRALVNSSRSRYPPAPWRVANPDSSAPASAEPDAPWPPPYVGDG